MQKKVRWLTGAACVLFVIAGIQLGPKIKYKVQYRRLRSAIERNELDTFKLHLPQHAASSLRRDDFEALILLACRFGRSQMVMLLVDDGPVEDLNFARDSMTPLLWAAASGNPELVKFLISRGARVSVVDDTGNSPLGMAIWRKKPRSKEIVEMLIASGAEVGFFTSIKSAVRIGDTNILQILLDSTSAAKRLKSTEVNEMLAWCENNSRQTKAYLSNYFRDSIWPGN